jgi:hypothetical protein
MGRLGSGFAVESLANTGGNVYFTPRYLDSPIVDTYREAAKVGEKVIRTRVLPETPLSDIQFNEMSTLVEAVSVGSTMMLLSSVAPEIVHFVSPSEYPDWIHRSCCQLEEIRREQTEAWATAGPIIFATQESLSDTAGASGYDPLDAPLWDDYIEGVARYKYWERIIDKFDVYKSSGGRRFLRVVSQERQKALIITQTMVYLINPLDFSGIYGFTYEQILMFKDLLYMRANAILACRWHYPDTPLLLAMKNLWKWQEECLTLYGNEGYELVKATESLSKAYISIVARDILTDHNDSYHKACTKIRAKEDKVCALLKLPSPTIYMADKFHNILITVPNVQGVVELFGLQKFTGHPLIDPKRGGRSAAEEARARDETSPDDANLTRAAVCSIFLENYIAQHKCWPPMEFPPGPETQLQRLHKSGTLRIHRGSYDLMDWVGVKFRKTFDFDSFENFTELLDDKAISYLMSDRIAPWDRKYSPKTERRLLLEVINRENISTVDIIDLVENDNVPLDWFIVALSPKEREFKLAARMFSMLVLEMRLCFAIHEANIADTILRYFPQITMTDNKKKVHERFLSMTRGVSDEEVARIFLELDLSRWNLRWRKLTVNMFGQDLNDLFGMRNFFTFAHSFFERATIMVRCAGIEPPGLKDNVPPESDLLWRNHLGGFEGLIQKMWSLLTVGMIETALRDLQAAYTLTVQGDNVVVTVTQPRDHTIPLVEQVIELRDSILANAAVRTAAVNQDLKPEECLESTTTITYSKYVYCKGVDYPTTIKATSRMFPVTSLDFPSVPAFVGAIYSSAVAAAEGAKHPMMCYYQAVFLASSYLRSADGSSGVYNSTLRYCKHLKGLGGTQLALLLPSELGGWPILLPYCFLYRGGSDPLSKSLAGLKMLQPYLPLVRRIICRSLQDSTYSTRPKIENLVQDPYGLPVLKPVYPADKVADMAIKYLQHNVVNKDLKEILNVDVSQYKADLIACLTQMVPFNSSVAHDIIEASIPGTAEKFSRLLTNTRTLQQKARESAGADMVDGLVTQGKEMILYMNDLFITLTPSEVTFPSLYHYVRLLRGRWLGAGVDVRGMTNYLPIDFDLSFSLTTSRTEIRAICSTLGRNPWYERGDEVHYLGSDTKQKRAEQGHRLYGKSVNVTPITLMASILAMSDQGRGMMELADSISLSRSNVKISDHIGQLSKTIGGTVSHRYQARHSNMGAGILGQSSVASHCTLDSNNAGFLSGTVDDYPLMFQEFFLYLLAMIDIYLRLFPRTEYIIAKIRIGDSPLEQILSDAPSLPAGIVPQAPRLTQTSMLFDAGVHLRRVTGPTIDGRIQPVKRPNMTNTVFSAMIWTIRTAIGGRAASRMLLEHGQRKLTIPIDIQELRALTVQGFLECAAVCIIENVVSTLQSDVRGSTVKSSYGTLLSTLGLSIVDTLFPTINHPLFVDDPAVVRLNIGSSPRYPVPVNTRSLLMGELSRVVVRQLDDPNSLYHTLPLVVFVDSPLSAMSDSVIIQTRRLLSRGVADRAISPDDANFCVGSTIKRLMKLDIATEEERLEGLHSLLLSYRTHRRGKDYVSNNAIRVCESVAHGRGDGRIYVCNTTARETLRSLRRIEKIRVELQMRDPDAGIIPGARVSPTFIVCDRPPMTSHVLTRIEHLLYRYYQHLRCPYDLASGACKAWGKMIPFLTGKSAMIIGSGLGGVAVALGRAGFKSLCGVDLRIDLPLELYDCDQYQPPLVRLYRFAHIYRQSELCVSTDGDWFNPRTNVQLLDEADYYDLLIIDLASEQGSSSDVVRMLVNAEYPKKAMIRVHGTRYSLSSFCSYLDRHSVVESSHLVYEHGPRSEWIFVASQFKPRGLSGPLYSRPGQHNDISGTQGSGMLTVTQILDVVLAHLGGTCGQTVHEALSNGINVFYGMLGSHSGRPDYRTWGLILSCAAVCDIVLTPQHTHEDRIIQASRSGIFSFGYSRSVTFSCLASDNLLYYVTVLGATLVGWTDYRLS